VQVAAALALYVPAAQVAQRLLPVPLKYPEVQPPQVDVALVALKYPAVHGVHDVAPGALYFPGLQSMQETDPPSQEYLPFSQLVQEEEPAAAYFPAAQIAHAVLPRFEAK
jgi:hypothetical protein